MTPESATAVAAAADRRRRYAEAIHRLGPRALYELLAELRRHHPGIAADLDRRVATYAAMDPQILVAAGGDRFPSAPIHAVEIQNR